MSPPPKGPLLPLGTHLRTHIRTHIRIHMRTPIGAHIRTHIRPKGPLLTHIRTHNDTYGYPYKDTYRCLFKDTYKAERTLAALRYTFSKVFSTVPFYSKCTRPLTIRECLPGASYRSLQCLGTLPMVMVPGT